MDGAGVKGWATAPPLQRRPSQQEPWRSIFVQGLVVPAMVQEGRWQLLMYTGTEKLPGGRGGEERSELRGQLRLSPRLTGQAHGGSQTYFGSFSD